MTEPKANICSSVKQGQAKRAKLTFADFLGKRSHRLVVVADHPHPRKIVCRCDCGNEAVTTRSNFRSGNTQSCGCLSVEVKITANTTHGLTNHPLYATWYEMQQRCFSSKQGEYKYYGGRGITVCERWMDVRNFIADMPERPPGCTLDRVDVNGNYEPGNCRWATKSQQMNNTRRNVNVTIDGVTKTVQEWSEISPAHCNTIRHRLNIGWEPRRAVFEPPKKIGRGANARRIVSDPVALGPAKRPGRAVG